MDFPSDPPRETDALIASAQAAIARQRFRHAAELARAALDRATALGNASSVAQARAVLAGVSVVLGDFETAGRLAGAALDHAAEHGPPELLASCCSALSFVCDRAGLAGLAVEHAVRALEAARACGDRAAESLALNRLGVAVRGSDESARAIGLLEESLRLARSLNAPDAAMWPLNNLASRWIDEADRLTHVGRDPADALQAARERALEAEAIARVSGSPLTLATIGANLAGIHRRLGEFDAARTRFLEAIELTHADGATDHETTYRLALASLDVEYAPSEERCAALEAALDTFPANIDAALPIRARRVLAQAYRTLGEPERACAQWERVLVETERAAGSRADAQWRFMQTREELERSRHEADRARVEARLQRLRAEADAELARELERHRDRLEAEVAARTAELREALAAAKAASRAKSVFLALVSHELRTPLNGVLGMVELARRRGTDARQLAQLETALTAARDLSRRVQQLLEFVAEPESAHGLATPTDVRRLLEDLVAEQQPAALAKGFRIVWQVADDLPARVPLDADRVRRVITAMLDNAVKFSSDGPVVVLADGSDDAATEGRLVLAVVDRGPGIDPERQQALFRPFELGDMSRTRTHGGLGLGLALAGRRAHAMGARIEVDSAPGRGSTLRLVIPVRTS